jgi:hypothetical protein
MPIVYAGDEASGELSEAALQKLQEVEAYYKTHLAERRCLDCDQQMEQFWTPEEPLPEGWKLYRSHGEPQSLQCPLCAENERLRGFGVHQLKYPAFDCLQLSLPVPVSDGDEDDDDADVEYIMAQLADAVPREQLEKFLEGRCEFCGAEADLDDEQELTNGGWLVAMVLCEDGKSRPGGLCCPACVTAQNLEVGKDYFREDGDEPE